MAAKCILLLLVLVSCCAFMSESSGAVPPHCSKDYHAAGVLPYTLDGGELWILLGHEPGRRYWTNFVGKRKDVDCIPAETASREFAEESRLAYPISETVQEILESESHVVVFDGKKKVHIWVVEVRKTDAADLEKYNGFYESEKDTYCWIKLRDVLAAVDRGESRTTPVPAHCKGNQPLHEDLYRNAQKGQEMRNLLDSLLNQPMP